MSGNFSRQAESGIHNISLRDQSQPNDAEMISQIRIIADFHRLRFFLLSQKLFWRSTMVLSHINKQRETLFYESFLFPLRSLWRRRSRASLMSDQRTQILSCASRNNIDTKTSTLLVAKSMREKTAGRHRIALNCGGCNRRCSLEMIHSILSWCCESEMLRKALDFQATIFETE